MVAIFRGDQTLYADVIFTTQLPNEEYVYMEESKDFRLKYFALALKYVLTGETRKRRQRIEVMEDILLKWSNPEEDLSELEKQCPVLFYYFSAWLDTQMRGPINAIKEAASNNCSTQSSLEEFLCRIDNLSCREQYSILPEILSTARSNPDVRYSLSYDELAIVALANHKAKMEQKECDLQNHSLER